MPGERYFREAMLLRIAPSSTQRIMCYIAERVLGLPLVQNRATSGRLSSTSRSTSVWGPSQA